MQGRLRTQDFDYPLPEELIAKEPSQQREGSRLMVLDRKKLSIDHKHFFDLPDYLKKGDVLVLNDTKVIPARLLGKKSKGGSSKEGEGGARVEVLFLRSLPQNSWECLVQPAKRIKKGYEIDFGKFCGVITGEPDTQRRIITFGPEIDVLAHLKDRGEVPLPPYIKEKLDEYADMDYLTKRYQTVYAKNDGASAAPTAGLHFTRELLKTLADKGTIVCYITLHTGAGTFKPVFSEYVDEHKMFSEEYSIPKETAEIIQRAKDKGNRVIGVGTTVVRTLEDCFFKHKKIIATRDEAEIFMYPPYKFNVADAMITNFHFPKSTLLMMISAFAGREFIFKAYKEAVAKKYRFYSFGDAMFIV